eukprot:scaffold110_cov315-Pavlova_lutheri.AAC.22
MGTRGSPPILACLVSGARVGGFARKSPFTLLFYLYLRAGVAFHPNRCHRTAKRHRQTVRSKCTKIVVLRKGGQNPSPAVDGSRPYPCPFPRRQIRMVFQS